jgi:hypothetical protein
MNKYVKRILFAILLLTCGVVFAQVADSTAVTSTLVNPPVPQKLVLILSAIWAAALMLLKALSLPEWKDLLKSSTFLVGLFQACNVVVALIIGNGIAQNILELLAVIIAGIMGILLARKTSVQRVIALAKVNGDVTKVE